MRRRAPLPPAYSFGDAGRNSVDGPGLQKTDVALQRDFPLVGNTRLQFRAEAFNVRQSHQLRNTRAVRQHAAIRQRDDGRDVGASDSICRTLVVLTPIDDPSFLRFDLATTAQLLAL
jgi:hypothetical protein